MDEALKTSRGREGLRGVNYFCRAADLIVAAQGSIIRRPIFTRTDVASRYDDPRFAVEFEGLEIEIRGQANNGNE